MFWLCLFLYASCMGLSLPMNAVKNTECTTCVDEEQMPHRWAMPLLKLGEKRYYLGIFFKDGESLPVRSPPLLRPRRICRPPAFAALCQNRTISSACEPEHRPNLPLIQANWYRAAQYCRFHGMHLASISSQEENDKLEKNIRDFGLGHEHFWTSGTDLAEEGSFFWMATGRPITFTNWNAGEPNNFRYENGEEENCLELWNRDGKGLKWNDTPCSFETYFICEVQ